MTLKHIGPVLFALTFIVGFSAASIRFVLVGSGAGALTGGHNVCVFSIYSSTYFEKVSRWTCGFEKESQAADYFERLAPANHPLEKSDSYVLIRIADRPEDHFCSSRLDGRFVTNICSRSLTHVRMYEREMNVDR